MRRRGRERVEEERGEEEREGGREGREKVGMVKVREEPLEDWKKMKQAQTPFSCTETVW